MLKIVPAETETQYQQIRKLLAEFIAMDTAQMNELGFDANASLEFYFASGAEELPGIYAPPNGRIFLASYSEKTAGCGAFRRITANACEMKRMYVRPEFRGKHVGSRLAKTLISTAREVGYNVMRLETTTYSDKAIALYTAVGFRTCEPYYSIPEGFRKIIVCMELDLLTVI
jgi:GNAT superfamily N-acetyltransferase